MAKGKPKPARVIESIARKALEMEEGNVQNAWSRYIMLHFAQTHDLAPGCDMQDLVRWYRNVGLMPQKHRRR